MIYIIKTNCEFVQSSVLDPRWTRCTSRGPGGETERNKRKRKMTKEEKEGGLGRRARRGR